MVVHSILLVYLWYAKLVTMDYTYTYAQKEFHFNHFFCSTFSQESLIGLTISLMQPFGFVRTVDRMDGTIVEEYNFSSE